LQQPLSFDGSIAVQARQSLAESHWLLGLADADSRVRGVVGWVDLQGDRVEEELAVVASHPKFRGVRHVVQDEPEDDFMLRPAFQRGIARLKQFGLCYDILIYPKQLPATLKLVQTFPEQPFVLDHIAKPLIRDGVISPWREQILELASFANVSCKVSGLVTEANHTQWQSAEFRPYLEVVFEGFGAKRLMFGSDWPVCLLAGSYEQVFLLVEDFVKRQARWDDTAQAAFFGGNCAQFYGVA